MLFYIHSEIISRWQDVVKELLRSYTACFQFLDIGSQFIVLNSLCVELLGLDFVSVPCTALVEWIRLVCVLDLCGQAVTAWVTLDLCASSVTVVRVEVE